MNDLVLAHPWLLGLLVVPLPIWWLTPPHRIPRRGLVVPFLARLADVAGPRPAGGPTVSASGLGRSLVLCLCWICAVLAVTRPQVIEPPVTRDVPARDLLLAVDLSGSMETKDFQDAEGHSVDRLTAVKAVLDDFLTQRQGDRVGLILFGSAPFVQAPFTEDLDVCRQLLDEAQVRMAGPQTAFGDALGLAINVFDRSQVQDRVLIALTDGNDTASQVPPGKAAQIARDKGIVIHTVAVGDPRAAGEDALDEATLEQVASVTGGLYSHAGDRQQLEAIYAQLDHLETRQVQTISQRPKRDVFWWPLVAGLALSMGYFAVGLTAAALPQRRSAAPRAAVSTAPAGLFAAAAAFHFLRPAWLLALLPAALLWWLLRRTADSGRPWRRLVAPHLLAHLWSNAERASRFGPLAGVGAAWILVILAISGPTWRQEPSPFAGDTATLALVVKVSPSMETEDLEPSRLQRAILKIHDLLQARGEARTLLIAYAGTAHLVMPATRDGGIVDTFARALSPELMPRDGDAAAAALALADRGLEAAGGGLIVWITDAVAPELAGDLAAWRSTSATPLRLWPPLPSGAELNAVEAGARAARPRLVAFSADDSDVQALAGSARFVELHGGAADARWLDGGYLLTPLICALLLPLFRRGWRVALPAPGVR